MEIQVHYTTQLKAALGRDSETLELADEATVRDVVRQLADRYPSQFGELVMHNDEPLPSILFSVNDRQVGLDESVSDGSSLVLLSAISGG